MAALKKPSPLVLFNDQDVFADSVFRPHSPIAVGSHGNTRDDETFEQYKMNVGMSTASLRATAVKICRDFLKGAWKDVTIQTMGWEQITGGMSNYLYKCSLPPSVEPVDKEPSQVLIRIYGQIHGETAFENIIVETTIFTVLSERQLGPKLYGVFPGGRLEEFIDAPSLHAHELRIPAISRQIARHLARMHCLDIPLTKKPVWMWDSMTRWVQKVEEDLKETMASGHPQEEMIRKIQDGHIKSEFHWLRAKLKQLDSPVVFAHNDLQEGNVLVHWSNRSLANENQQPERVAIIDFEYCAYNYRGFDLANHLCEWIYNYKSHQSEPPFFKRSREDWPTVEEQRIFYASYLESIAEVGGASYTGAKWTVDDLLHETDWFAMASHFFWFLWGAVNAPRSEIKFGYWEYASTRLEDYFDKKETVLKSSPIGNGFLYPVKDDSSTISPTLGPRYHIPPPP